MKKIVLGLLFSTSIAHAADKTPGAIAWEKARGEVSCSPPNGALALLHGTWSLNELKFSCWPYFRRGHSATKFTALTKENQHILGYVWRDSFNIQETSWCSYDGAWPGGWDGECPEGVLTDENLHYTEGLAK